MNEEIRKNEINDEELDKVSGGWVSSFENATYCERCGLKAMVTIYLGGRARGQCCDKCGLTIKFS